MRSTTPPNKIILIIIHSLTAMWLQGKEPNDGGHRTEKEEVGCAMRVNAAMADNPRELVITICSRSNSFGSTEYKHNTYRPYYELVK